MNYNKEKPFLAAIKERYTLTKGPSEKSTHHIVLDLAGSGIRYSVGDTIGIFPIHDPYLVQKILDALNVSGTETIIDKKTEEPWQLTQFLSQRANLTEISRKFLSEVAQRQTHSAKKEQLLALFQPEAKEELKKYLQERELWELLEENPEAHFSPQEFCNLAMPLLPRFYSIASSQITTPNELHLTVAMVEYQHKNNLRRGICSHYLCHMISQGVQAVPIYLQPHHGFTLPENSSSPMIMVGPGTGIAPFRAFMQERIAKNASGPHWLFFGARSRLFDFFYEEEWQEYTNMGKLRLDTAFSRDQTHKIYVQHRMLEAGQELFSWLEQGAFFYVCGDAKQMARDVEAALQQIVQKHGNLSEERGRQYIKELRNQKRYLRDVY